jgi:hypothetical protein
MAARQGLELLKQRKRELVAESDLNRLTLRLELENIHASTQRISRVVATGFRMGPWLLPLVSLIGLVAGRAARKRSQALISVATAARVLPRALSWWRRFAGRVRPTHAEES